MAKAKQEHLNGALEACAMKAAYMNLVIQIAASNGQAGDIIDKIEEQFAATVKNVAPNASSDTSDSMLNEAIDHTLNSMRQMFDEIRFDLL